MFINSLLNMWFVAALFPIAKRDRDLEPRPASTAMVGAAGGDHTNQATLQMGQTGVPCAARPLFAMTT